MRGERQVHLLTRKRVVWRYVFLAASKNIGKKFFWSFSSRTSPASIVFAERRFPPAGVITWTSGLSMMAWWTSSV